MKNKICSILIIFCLTLGLLGCPKQTNESEPEFEPKPLIIEPQEYNPIGVYEGTIVITGAGTEESGYEGLILVTFDGDKIRITCTDAVRSKFGDRF